MSVGIRDKALNNQPGNKSLLTKCVAMCGCNNENNK